MSEVNARVDFNKSQLLLYKLLNESTMNSDFLIHSDQSSNNIGQTFNENVTIEMNESFLSEEVSNLILVIFYSFIVLMSLLGNCFVCRVMLTLKGSNRTTTNMLILNLALSDLLLTTFNIPVNIARFVSRDWPFGHIICTMTPFIQSLSAHCSSITMMVIAYERYQRQVINNNFLAYI